MVRGTYWAMVLAILVSITASTPANAQDFRGSIVGKVTDSSGAVLPGVTVTIANDETKVQQNVVTDNEGAYRVPYLNVGAYSVSAALSGFKKVVKTGLQVTVGDAVKVDIVLEPGPVSEVVSVVAESPMLNTTTGVSGITIDAKQIAQLPLGDGTAYMLTRLAPGIMDTSDLHFARPMDNGNLAGIVSNGVQGGNEFTIDGTFNMSNARGTGFSPPSDAISSFKVQTNAFDSQVGHTAGAVVNLALKSGTNRFRVQAGYFNRDASRTEIPLLTERAGAAKPSRTYNRLTGTGSGPIIQGRTFFMVSAEYLRDVQPEPSTYTVPTMKMRNGDFSEFPTLVYDPNSAFLVGSTVTRLPFNGNIIPDGRINPVARAYASYYPEPNRPGTVGNYFTNMLRPYDYHAFLTRIDHNLNESHRMFFTAYYSKRQEDRYNWALGAPNSPDGFINGYPITQGFDYRSNLGFTGGWTSVLSNTSVFDLRASVTRFGEYRNPAADFDPANLGFSATALQLMQGHNILPLMTIGTFSTTNAGSTIASLGTQRSDWNEGFNRPMTTYAVTPTVTKNWGDHAVRLGYDLRYQSWLVESAGYPAGRFRFDGSYTRLNNGAATNDRAQSFAQFLLGLPTNSNGAVAAAGTASSQFEIASTGDFRQTQHGIFLQDDWRVNDRLTLNLGLRFELLGGMSEVADRNLAGFDTTSASPVEAQAKANYANSPIPQVPVSEFDVKGGLLYADGPVNDSRTKVLPRASASYLLTPKTVIRGGIGEFSYDFFFENTNQTGYSQATPVIVTNDNGLTFTGANLTNPIPNGQLIQPVGNALGLSSQLGQNLGTIYQPDREVALYTRWEMSVQQELPHSMVVAVTYLGSRGRNLPVVRAINNIPIQFLSTSRTRDVPNETLLANNVANPFANMWVGSGNTVQRQQLMRPHPQFGTISVEQYDGSDRYDAVSLQFDKRFRGGNSLTVQYTRSSLHDKLNYLNPADSILEDRISPNDRPNRFTVGTSLQIPIGRDGYWGKDFNDLAEAVLGGWRLSATYQYQSGFPLTWGAVYWDQACGDPKSLKSYIGKEVAGGTAGLDVPGWDVSCFYFHDSLVQTGGVDNINLQRADPRINLATANNVRYFPSTLPNVRTHQLHLMDFGVGKSFTFGGGATMQVRIEFINALNYTVLWNPGVDPRANTGLFGVVNQDRNNPRDIQLGLRFTF